MNEAKRKKTKRITPKNAPLDIFYSTIVFLLKQHQNMQKVADELGMSKQNLNYYLKRLRMFGAIKCISENVWEINDALCSQYISSVKKHQSKLVVGLAKSKKFKENNIRGHGFQIRVKIPRKIMNWEFREERLKKLGVNPKQINKNKLNGIMDISFEYRGHRVWLCDDVIIVYWSKFKSYYEENAFLVKLSFLYDLYQYLRQLESFIGIDIKVKLSYLFQVTRGHLALIRNALARYYNEKKVKFEVRDEFGELWLIIDNSPSFETGERLQETEVQLNKNLGFDDATNIADDLKDMFNYAKRQGFTTDKEKIDTLENNLKLLSDAVVKQSEASLKQSEINQQTTMELKHTAQGLKATNILIEKMLRLIEEKLGR